MKVKIAKWGNSLAIRLPKRYADDLGLKLGSTVDVERDGTRLAIETVPEHKIPRYRLEDLLAQIKPGQVPPYEDWGILPTEWPAEDWSDIAPSDAEWEAWKREAEEQAKPNEAAKAEDRGAIPPRRRA
jgi:antitoxin MazE